MECYNKVIVEIKGTEIWRRKIIIKKLHIKPNLSQNIEEIIYVYRLSHLQQHTVVSFQTQIRQRITIRKVNKNFKTDLGIQFY